MKSEDKELLFKDLCARLPYGVKVTNGIHTIALKPCSDISIIIKNEHILPYLRPMSSMTEKEKEKLKSKCIHTETEENWDGVRCDVWGIQILDKYDTKRWDNPIWPSPINMDAIDWLNANHFDYRNLIEKGLAIEVTKENNPYKD